MWVWCSKRMYFACTPQFASTAMRDGMRCDGDQQSKQTHKKKKKKAKRPINMGTSVCLNGNSRRREKGDGPTTDKEKS